MKLSFEGRNIVITGASGVIGSTFVKALVQEGAHVGLIGRSREKLEKLMGEVNTKSTHDCFRSRCVR